MYTIFLPTGIQQPVMGVSSGWNPPATVPPTTASTITSTETTTLLVTTDAPLQNVQPPGTQSIFLISSYLLWENNLFDGILSTYFVPPVYTFP